MNNSSIDQLSSTQAQHALLIFYDLLPASMWPADRKPSAAELEAVSENVQDAATGPTAQAVQALLAEGNDTLKGEASRSLLRRFQEAEELRPLVEQAIARARQPDMGIPLLIGAFIVGLAVLPRIEYVKEGKKTKLRVTINPSKNAGALVGKLAELVKALPPAIFGELK
jgi:hypothetical protein